MPPLSAIQTSPSHQMETEFHPEDESQTEYSITDVRI